MTKKRQKTLFIGGPFDGKKEHISILKPMKYFIHKPKRYSGLTEHFKYELPYIEDTISYEQCWYYPKTLTVGSRGGNAKEFTFMVNDPNMSEIDLIEKLISGHRSMRK